MGRTGRIGILAAALMAFPTICLAQGEALNSPDCIKAPEARAERPTDEVLGVGRNGEFCAYPVRMMAYHRIVNDHLGGPPILVFYDPTSAVGAVYDPVLDSKELAFDVAGEAHGIPMIKDRLTGSLWNAVSGEAVQGPYLGRTLKRIPCWMVSWGAWQKAHNDSWVLKEEGSQSVHYVQRATQATCAVPMMQPGAKTDSRLPIDALVLGVATDKFTVAATTDRIARIGILNTRIVPYEIVFFAEPGRGTAAYSPKVNGKHLTFIRTRSGAIQDIQTHSEWNIEGRAVAGPLKGSSLTPFDFVRARWYAWSAAHPGTTVIIR